MSSEFFRVDWIRVGQELVLASLVLGCLLSAGPARAFVPEPDRILKALAETNQVSGRTQSLAADVVLLGSSEAEGAGMTANEAVEGLRHPEAVGQPVARGTLVSHPSGLAKLELRYANGTVERYLQRGTELLASRDGKPTAPSPPLLFPFFLLQNGDPGALRAILATYSIDLSHSCLGQVGDRDAYVLGRREPWQPQLQLRETAEEPSAASFWLAIETFAPLRLLRTDGSSYELGPQLDWNGVVGPAWIELREPELAPKRMQIRSIRPVDAPPATFDESWLFGADSPFQP